MQSCKGTGNVYFQGFVKLADFGVATKLTEADVSTHSVVGTPYCMAPEGRFCNKHKCSILGKVFHPRPLMKELCGMTRLMGKVFMFPTTCTSEYSHCKQCKHQLLSWLLLYINSGSNNEDYGQRGCDLRGNHNHRQPMRKIPMKKSQNISSSSKRIHKHSKNGTTNLR
ncbi:hypothetical protein MRB53_026188 [Persea americana]|uniref:Uncharacterized protein n=1 Tax=Persea americana TaxID=3435 RepID=A0ACC2LIH3_PERAE|nr:hypothetical protein MRB53_026188 [Persea americana]